MKNKGVFYSVLTPLISAFIGYLFSLHVDFITLKAQVISHEEIVKEINKKLERLDQNLILLLKRN